jgi:DNA-binding MarR family transcriptional regulator
MSLKNPLCVFALQLRDNHIISEALFEELKTRGLIQEVKHPGIKDRHVITLTEKGKAVAMKLRAFMEIIDEQPLRKE